MTQSPFTLNKKELEMNGGKWIKVFFWTHIPKFLITLKQLETGFGVDRITTTRADFHRNLFDQHANLNYSVLNKVFLIGDAKHQIRVNKWKSEDSRVHYIHTYWELARSSTKSFPNSKETWESTWNLEGFAKQKFTKNSRLNVEKLHPKLAALNMCHKW